MLNLNIGVKMKTYFKLETLRNNCVGSEAVDLNYYSTQLGSELDSHYALVVDDRGVDLGVCNTEKLNIVETTTVTYAIMCDRRLHTQLIEAVIDSTGTLWVDAELVLN
jgi:hypothetical protein